MEAFAAEVPDGAPAYFRWRRIRHRILKSEGPERIAMEWWIDGVDAKERDYFSVEDEQGYRFWIYREGHYGPDMPQWFMHGVFA
jgi:protein ImuB